MKNPSTLIFIGNGFDCALGYPTSYKNFFESDKFQTLPTDNLLAKHIKDLKDRTNQWSDLEVTLSNYSHGSLDLVKSDGATRFRNEFVAVQNALYSYLKSISGDRSDEPARFISMGSLIKDWIKEDPNCRFYTFNYTLFLERVLKFLNPDEIPNVVHLHGILSEITKGNGLVIGIDKTMQTHKECDFLFKANQENYNNTGIKTAVQNAKRLIFFGCSMGVSDTWYFNLIFQNQNINVVEIYDRGQEKMNDFYAKIEHFSNESLDDYKEHTRLKYYDSSDVYFAANQRGLFNQSNPEYLHFL